jgi:hypothetical protein
MVSSSMVARRASIDATSREGGGDGGKLHTGSYMRFYGVEDFQNL